MRSLLSCLKIGVGHQRTPSQPDDQHNSSEGENTTRPASSEQPILPIPLRPVVQEPIPVRSESGEIGSSTILMPKPRKPNTTMWSYLLNYIRTSTAVVNNLSGARSSSSDSSDNGVKSEGGEQASPPIMPYPRKLSKEERAMKVQKYLEKKRKKSNTKKIRYQYRQQLAARRIRFQGRFVKAAEAKDLILKGAPVTAKDMTDLERIFEEDKDQELIKKYNENLRQHAIKPIFKTIHDTSVVDRLSGSESGSSSSGSEGSSFGTGMSPLIETIREMNINNGINEQCVKMGIQPPPVFKL